MGEKYTMLFWIEKSHFFLRCENMDRMFFLTWLSQFRSSFPKAIWDSTQSAWKLPLKDIQGVAVFSYEFLGDGSFVPKSSSDTPQQLRLL